VGLAAAPLAGHEPRLVERRQVLRDRLTRHRQLACQRAGRDRGAGREHLHDLAAGRIGQRGEDRADLLLARHHARSSAPA
jgi:hypothetical protein